VVGGSGGLVGSVRNLGNEQRAQRRVFVGSFEPVLLQIAGVTRCLRQ